MASDPRVTWWLSDVACGPARPRRRRSRAVPSGDTVRGRLDDDPGHDLAHALRVALWTVVIGRASGRRPSRGGGRGPDARLVNLPKDGPERHLARAQRGRRRAELPAYGFDADAVDRIAEAVRDHRSREGRSPDALSRALQDADRSRRSALGLFRCISTGRGWARYFAE